MKISFYQEAANIILFYIYIYIYIKIYPKEFFYLDKKIGHLLFFLIKKSFYLTHFLAIWVHYPRNTEILKKKFILKTKDIFNQLNQIQYKRSNNFYETSKIGIPLFPTETFKQKEF